MPHRQQWYTLPFSLIYYATGAAILVGFSLLAYHSSAYRSWSGYISGAFGGAVFAFLLMIGWLLWRGRGPLVRRHRLNRLSTASTPFFLLNTITGYAVTTVETQQATIDPQRRSQLHAQRARYYDTLVLVEQWHAERTSTAARDLPALIDAALADSHYALDEKCIRTLIALATAPEMIEISPLPQPTT